MSGGKASRQALTVKEDAVHIAIADLLRVKARPDVIWWHTANERRGTIAHGVKLKRMGVLAGVPDFCVVIPESGRVAFLEVKAPKGSLSPAQRVFRDRCIENGLTYAVVRSSEDAEHFLSGWRCLRVPADVQRSKEAA